jgi:hypothetical protein
MVFHTSGLTFEIRELRELPDLARLWVDRKGVCACQRTERNDETAMLVEASAWCPFLTESHHRQQAGSNKTDDRP